MGKINASKHWQCCCHSQILALATSALLYVFGLHYLQHLIYLSPTMVKSPLYMCNMTRSAPLKWTRAQATVDLLFP